MCDETSFSLIVPFRNCAYLTRRLVKSLETTLSRRDYELVLVDTASDQRTLRSLQRLDRAVIVNGDDGERFSFYRSLNKGARIAQGEILIFVNNDVEFWSRDLLGAIEVALSSNPKLGLVVPQMVLDDTMPASVADPYVDIVDYHQAGYLLAMPRYVYDLIGGFEEAYCGYGFEEADLAIRLARHGYRVGVMPRACCKHRGFATYSKIGIVVDSALLANALVFSRIHGYPIGPHIDIYQDLRMNFHSLATHAVATELEKHLSKITDG